MRKVMVFGTFDILHKGHEDFIRQAKHQGDFLYVVVAQDKNVAKIKGRAPINNINKRIEQLKNKGLGDEIMTGDETDFLKAIEEKKPDIICLGYDQESLGLEKENKQKGWNITIKRMKPFNRHIHKSSIIRKNNNL